MTQVPSNKTAGRPLDVLVVADHPADAERCRLELTQAGLEVRCEVVQTSHEFCALLSAKTYHVILSNYSLPGWNGAEVLELLQQMEKEIPFILLTGESDVAAAVGCLQNGAADYVEKDRLSRLPVAIRRALTDKMSRDERVRTERKWRESEMRYQRLAELSPDALFIQSDEEIIFVNAAGARLLGAESPEQLLGKPAESIVHPDSRAALGEHLENLAARVEPSSFDQKFLRLDGTGVEVKAVATVLTYKGQPAVQFIARDLTERKRVEEAIKSLASFAQLNPNPVLEFARDGRLTYFNEAASAMAQSLGHDHPNAILPPETVSIVQTCLTTGQRRLRLETSIAGRTISWSFYPIKPNQVVHCYAGDITERENLEAQLRHSQKLESVGRLAAGVAHDFNNIITVIQGHVGLLRSDGSAQPPMDESLQQVSRAAERASKLTNQLLIFSRKSAIHARRLDLNEVLANLSMMLHRTLGEDIAFQFEYAPELPPILADLGMIEQVVMNLAVNARDAMPRGGQVVISTAAHEIDRSYAERHPDARAGRFVCLSITDGGCGMDHVTLGRLFEPFFTTKEFGKGTGLGLATVYGIIKRHQGWIEVRSQVGQGSSFRIFLPASDRASEPGPAKPAEATARGGHETILVVEDEAPVRAIIRNILMRRNYNVLEAGNGVEALAVWHHHHQDITLLLTDMIMPVGLNGQELAEKFRSQKPGLKVIYTSGYNVETMGRGFEMGEGISFLEKPFDAGQLAQAVRNCLDKVSV